MKLFKKMIKKVGKITYLVLIIYGILFTVYIILNIKNFDLDDFTDQCYFKKVFNKKTYEGNYLLSSGGRDSTRFCSFTLNETEKNLKNFKKIDEEYFENQRIEFIFETIDYLIENKGYFGKYDDKKVNLLKNIRSDLQNLEKDEGVLYYYFILEEGLEDYAICYYKKSENKGYCIINHI